MPVHVEKCGTEYCVRDDKGKTHGMHATRSKAKAQVTAMNISMGYVPGVKPRKDKKG